MRTGTGPPRPDDRWDVELYDLARDPGEEHDLAAARPAQADALAKLMHESWAPVYPRRPFGVTLEVTGGGAESTVTATLANGSARPWRAARLTLDAPSGRLVHAPDAAAATRLDPGEHLTTHWQVTRPQVSTATTLTCRARPTAGTTR
ncbi:NEW3 domain-containing protein [Streptomyces sp. NPDC059629]|uniref:NEW3 domain-containing protein n=1 Tax=Streptomyces sp. NPDC059629 TaxID=3346889 RepID=UPI0036CB22C1